MATNATELQKYFADMDAEEERVGEKYGISPDEVRQFEMQDFGEEMTPPSLQKPSEYARPNPRAAVGLERMGLRLNPPIDMPETVPPLAMPSGMPAKTSDFASLQKTMSPGALASPIPVASAPVKADVPEAMKGAIAPTTSMQPAPPAGTSSTVKPPPVDAGSGGDDEMGRLSMGQALVRALEGSGSVISGQNLRSGAADTLGERMKQIEALRAKRAQTAEERALEASTWGASNRSTLASALAQWKGDPEKTAALEALASGADTTKPGDFSRNVVNAVMTKPKVLGAEAGVAKTNVQIPDIQAGTAVKVAKAAEIGPEGESKRRAREQAAALGWARLNAQSAEAAARAAEKAATTTTDSNAIRSELDKIQKITQKGGYVPLAAALEQADTAIADLGRPPSMAAQAKHALPGGDRFLSPEEKAYFNSVDKLKQMEQLAISGKVVSESERKEFVRQYGTSWYANPTAAAAYIDLLRQKTASQIRMDLATIRATPIGKEALRLYEAENGLTENAAVLKGKGAATRPAKPIAVPAGKTVLWNVAEGKWKAIPNDNAEAAVASGKYER